MGYIQEFFRLVMMLFIWVIIIIFFIKFVNYIGRTLGIGKVIVNISKKIRDKLTRIL
ncbi:hypothetical protein [Senegalia sp. (in: firmicutes)]|uniref:hypothetical protein n=1 Tax=Senegalia sp. (in: firmicutes) TaxID=1924098 RepID=UPI003F94D19D